MPAYSPHPRIARSEALKKVNPRIARGLWAGKYGNSIDQLLQVLRFMGIKEPKVTLGFTMSMSSSSCLVFAYSKHRSFGLDLWQ